MINTYYSQNNYVRPTVPFGAQKIKADKILKDFARKIDLSSTPQEKLPKELFKDSPNYKYIQEVRLQLVKAEPGVLPANHRALNLVVDSKKDGLESSERTWLKTGSIQDIRDYLRQNPTESHIKTKVANLLKESFEEPNRDY